MTLDAIMWIGLFIAGLATVGYLLAVLLHPEKW
ncbi:potassium-transporting ATPase subunit F [Arthrobacter sp. YN]|nr:potassium-transporting ATPase subunit F [Arthrobacter sp. YN]